tara:strand:- start:12447 stop:14573 length:2127 start_codon:yes stop_codon:yes gene_type:complete
MKKIFTLLLSILFFIGNISAQMNFCDDFENYSSAGLTGGDPIAQTSSHWNSWDELMNGATAPFTDDCNVTNPGAGGGPITAYSGTNTLYLKENNAGQGGPQDIVFMFDTTQNINQSILNNLSTPHVAGDLIFSQMMYVRTGAYLNFQAENTPGVQWALEVNLDPTGDILMSNTNGTSFAASFPLQQWFEFKFEIDLSNNNWELFIDGISQGSFSNTINQISSLDLYTRAGDEYYVDDVCFDYTPATLAALNGQAYATTPIEGIAGQQRYPSVDVRNFGTNDITSFDITIDYNGTQITENVTNINLGFGLASLQIMTVDFQNSITLVGGSVPATAYIYNINGGMMQSTSDDTIALNISAVTPAPGKLVIGEEATGTWCGWCPRGAVALNWMEKDYKGYWEGIAVHNGSNDPMVNGMYDAGLGGIISGYPSGVVDRGPDIDPSDFKIDFLQRIQIAPSAVMTNGAQLSGDTLRVSMIVDYKTTVGPTYKLACVITEDSVKGSGPGYYQANSYSGGNAGSLIDVDGSDWAQKPGNVPDYMMTYRHVARYISPSFYGESLNQLFPGQTYNTGDKDTICYEFILDPSWDKNQIHIIGMFIDPNNMIDNGSSTTISEAETNGYYSCYSAPTSTIELNGPDKVNIYPNPAKNSIYVNNLKEENSLLKIYDITGKLVMKQKISNNEYIDISKLTKGLYQLTFEGTYWKENRRIVKD